jgi:hypothetical protein
MAIIWPALPLNDAKKDDKITQGEKRKKVEKLFFCALRKSSGLEIFTSLYIYPTKSQHKTLFNRGA